SARRETSDVVSLALARWWLFFALVEWIAAAARRWRGGLPVLGSATWRTALIRMSLTTVGAVLAFAAVLTGGRAIQSRNVAGVVRAYHDAPRDTLDVVRLIDGDVESVRLPADVLARDDDGRSGEDTASVTLLAADLDAGACGAADLPLSVRYTYDVAGSDPSMVIDSLPGDARGGRPTIYFPVYSVRFARTPVHPGGATTFVDLAIPAKLGPCLARMSKVRLSRRDLPRMTLQIGDGWETLPRYDTRTSWRR